MMLSASYLSLTIFMSTSVPTLDHDDWMQLNYAMKF